MIETVELFTAPGLTLTAQLFAVNSDVVVATADSVTEQPNVKGAYLVEFDGVAPGTYLVVAYESGIAVAAAYTALAETVAVKRTGFYADVVAATHVELMRKIAVNKQITDPTTGVMTVYDDDDVTPLLEAQMYEDAAETQPYRGRGAEVRERLT